jgi:hypothetical protein
VASNQKVILSFGPPKKQGFFGCSVI